MRIDPAANKQHAREQSKHEKKPGQRQVAGRQRPLRAGESGRDSQIIDQTARYCRVNYVS